MRNICETLGLCAKPEPELKWYEAAFEYAGGAWADVSAWFYTGGVTVVDTVAGYVAGWM